MTMKIKDAAGEHFYRDMHDNILNLRARLYELEQMVNNGDTQVNLLKIAVKDIREMGVDVYDTFVLNVN